MPTPASLTPSTQTPYLTPAEFLKRYDARSIGDRVKDDGTRADPTALLTDANLQALINQASGMFESAILKGNRYVVADLQALLTASPANVAVDYIRGVVADLTLWLIYNRRPSADRPVPKQCELALTVLEQLSAGYRIFGLQEKMNAALRVPIVNPLTGVVAPRSFDPITSRASRIFPE